MMVNMDYDGVFSENPDLWRRISALLTDSGHQIIMITSRNERTDPIEEEVGMEIVYTDGMNKREYCSKFDIPLPDVWIDDMPEYI